MGGVVFTRYQAGPANSFEDRQAEETKEAVDSLLLMGEWFAFGAGDMGNTCALLSSMCQNAPFLFLFCSL